MPWMDTGHGTEVYVVSDPDSAGLKFHSKQPCPHCGRMFATPDGMQTHIKTKHE